MKIEEPGFFPVTVTHEELLQALGHLAAKAAASVQPQPEPEPNNLLDAAKAARRLGVKKSWIMSKARSGALPCVRVGRYIRFRPEALDSLA